MNERASGNEYHGSEVAVIGMACRLPKARNVEEFWRNLCDGVEAITFFDDEELEAAGVDRAELDDPHYVKAAPILDDVELFDASFFDYTPREAEVMDPQQRLFLECAWEALEHSGYGAGLGEGSIGVFAGGKMSTYIFNIYSNPERMRSLDTLDIGLGNDIALLSMRASYKLDLDGPSYFVQSACSTSLVAVHLACQSLLTDECRMALAGAVAIDVPHKRGYRYQEGSLNSPDGHVRAFDAKAQGTIFGSGLGAVVLKRLEDAVADGDRIYAVIKGSATNNDGAAKANFTAPSVDGEARVILEALVNAEVRPETISYVEAHGTGTHLGDPIEIRALTKAFHTGTDEVAFCALGSVKTNLGHLDAAAGVSGLIKTVLALDRRQLPPSLHFEEPNPKIDFAGSPFYVNTALAPWSDALGPRRAGVSSFGFGGTNSHVVVEQAPPARASGRSRPWQLLVVSAKSEPALEAATDRLRNHLAEHPDLNLADVAYTLKLGRRAFRHRRAVVAPSCAEAVRVLEERDPQLVYTRFQKSAETPVVFLFSGQGAQYVNMARELYLGEPTFRDEVDRCSEILESHLGVDLRTLLYPPEDQVADAARRLEQTSIAQPALFVVEVALAGLWREWGVRPQAMIGHSIGEYAAAYLAGVFALEDALALVAARGRLMQEMPAGAMLSVALAAEEVRPLVGEALSLAAVNGPGRCVVSGPAEAIDAVARQLVDQGVQHRSLHTSHAFHSAMMDPILEPFLEKVREVRRSAPQIPFLSNVTGGWISDEAATDPHYWVEHLRKTVRFSEGLGELLREPERVLLEVGPGNALHTFAREHPRRSTDQAVVHSLPHPNDRRSDLAFLLTAAARLWLAGVEIDGAGFYARERRHRVPLPSYPFEHQRYWIEPQLQVEHDAGWVRSQKSPEIAAWFYLPVWRAGFPRAPLAPGQLAAQQETWLVFVDGCALGSEIVDRLKGEAQRVMTVTAGSRYARLPGGAFTVNPHRPADYQQLIQDLEAPPNTVIHLWNVSQSGAETPGKEGFKTAQTVGYYSLLFLAQALAAAGLEDPLKLVVVSRGLHDVSGLEESYPEKATLLGPCMVIPQEHQHILCLSIDVAIPGWGTGELATQILAEAASQPTDLIVAYRGNRRWVQAYERTNWQAPKDLSERLRDQGVYLITGGLGNIGMLLAEYLARTVRARLVLLGRSALPPRDEWTRWLATHDEQEAKSRRIRKILALEQLGAEVLIARADVADPEQMRSVIETIDERFGELHGVIHTAGILQGESIYRPLTEMGHSESEVQFGPKVYGLYVLEEVLAGRTLDFCVLLSSNAAVLGGLGFVGYSAANLFMDAFAANRGQRDRLRWISSNWDEWPGAVAPGERTLQTSMAEFAMTREESFDAFHRVISQAPPGQVVVSTGDLEPRLELWIRPASKLRKHEGKRHARPALETSYVAPTSETEQLVADLWQEILGIEQVGRNDNFFDLGGHSLLATQLMSRVRGALEIELPVESLFEAPTVAGLTRHIEAIRWATLGQEGLTGAAAADRDEGEL